MLDVIKKRRSIRKYKQQDVEAEKIKEILKAAQFSPSANHLKPWEFIVVKDKQLKEKLSQTTPWASFAADSSVIIVILADEQKSNDWLEDGAVAAENIYLETVNQGLGTCWIQVRNQQNSQGKDSEKYVKEILRIPETMRIICLLPIGYPDEHLSEHDDKEYSEQKIHYEKYNV